MSFCVTDIILSPESVIDFTDPLSLARELIRCPSITPDDAGALATVEEALRSLGFLCYRLPFSDDGRPVIQNLYARRGTVGPNFCFAGHTDVVPPGGGWNGGAFDASIRDGYLFGRGAVDMKGAIACFIAAVTRYLSSSLHETGSISLLITGDEEGLATDGTVRVLEWLREHGEVLDVCLVGEPTNPSRLGEMIKIGRRGSLNGHLTVFGTQGHSAYPHLADNPVERLVRMLSALTAQPLDSGSKHFQASTLALTTIDVGNPATNVIPAEAHAGFNIRFNDLHSSHSLEKWLHQTFDDIGGRYELSIDVSGESFLTQPGPFSDCVVQAIRDIARCEPELSTSGGTSDARFIKNLCPVVEFGLVGQTMHKADECVSLADMEMLTRIYQSVLSSFFSPTPP